MKAIDNSQTLMARYQSQLNCWYQYKAKSFHAPFWIIHNAQQNNNLGIQLQMNDMVLAVCGWATSVKKPCC